MTTNHQHQPDLLDRQVATILAALRAYQSDMKGGTFTDTDAICCIATNGYTLEPLTPEEIDTLCERLNTTTSTERPTQ